LQPTGAPERGVLLATRSTSKDGDSVSIFLISSATYDDVDDAGFALPEAVRKAAERAKAGRRGKPEDPRSRG